MTGRKIGLLGTGDRTFGLHLGRTLPGTQERFSVGAGIKSRSFQIGESREGTVSFDLGGRFKSKAYTLGISFLDLGSGSSPRWELSASHSPFPSFAVSASLGKRAGEGAKFSTGAEYDFLGVLALRGRLALAPGSSFQSGLSGFGGGIGLKTKSGPSLDYSFEPFSTGLSSALGAGTVHQMTVTLRFGAGRRNK